jgi:plasmid stabilization system protein ParE
MPKSVIWAPSAESDLAAILDYLNTNWDSKVSLNFIDLTENVVDQISVNPKQYPVIYKRKRIRKCVLTKHNSLFYRESRSQVEILRIYDTRQDPDTLRF